MRVLEQLKADKLAKPWSVYLTQSVSDDEGGPIEWYMLNSDEEALQHGSALSHGLPTIKADRMKTGKHVAHGCFWAVSEQFKSVVEKNRLTGLEFVWVRDVGKYQAMQWYMPIALNYIGRGIDHAWFDRKKLNKHPDWRKQEDAFWRSGVSWFFFENLKDHLNLGDPFKERLFSLFRERNFCVVSFLTMLRKYLPQTDFAFFGGERDKEFQRPEIPIQHTQAVRESQSQRSADCEQGCP